MSYLSQTVIGVKETVLSHIHGYYLDALTFDLQCSPDSAPLSQKSPFRQHLWNIWTLSRLVRGKQDLLKAQHMAGKGSPRDNDKDNEELNRHSSHGHHGSKRHELAQHAHSRGLYTFTHTVTSTQLQPCCAKRQLS